MGGIYCCRKIQDYESIQHITAKESTCLIGDRNTVSYNTDIVSNGDDIKRQNNTIKTNDIQTSDIAYNFNVDMMKEYLINGYYKHKNYIPSAVVDIMGKYCDELIGLFIPIFDTGKVIIIAVNRSCKILVVKEIIAAKTGIPVEQQVLQTKELGKPLHDEVSIDDYNLNAIQDHLTLRRSYFDD